VRFFASPRAAIDAPITTRVRPPITEPTKYRLSVDDVFRMQETGILPPDHRCELIHGELIEMPGEADLHSFWKRRLITWLARLLDPRHFTVGPDTTFFLDREEAPEPDTFIATAPLRPSQVRGDSALLVVEVADTSLKFDRTVKADLYQTYGVREYWVIDVNVCLTHAHERQADGAWAITEIPFDQALTPTQLPGASLTLATLS
jgi:Uma2 family endonuclease